MRVDGLTQLFLAVIEGVDADVLRRVPTLRSLVTVLDLSEGQIGPSDPPADTVGPIDECTLALVDLPTPTVHLVDRALWCQTEPGAGARPSVDGRCRWARPRR